MRYWFRKESLKNIKFIDLLYSILLHKNLKFYKSPQMQIGGKWNKKKRDKETC
jgi:hypothetical protein